MVKTSDNTNLLGVVRPVNTDKALSTKKISLAKKKYGIDIQFIPKAKNKFKKKRRTLSRWKRYKLFAESNRISRLGLRHWGTKKKNWIFAKFDKKTKTLRYTDEEYRRCNIVDNE